MHKDHWNSLDLQQNKYICMQLSLNKCACSLTSKINANLRITQ